MCAAFGGAEGKKRPRRALAVGALRAYPLAPVAAHGLQQVERGHQVVVVVLQRQRHGLANLRARRAARESRLSPGPRLLRAAKHAWPRDGARRCAGGAGAHRLEAGEVDDGVEAARRAGAGRAREAPPQPHAYPRRADARVLLEHLLRRRRVNQVHLRPPAAARDSATPHSRAPRSLGKHKAQAQMRKRKQQAGPKRDAAPARAWWKAMREALSPASSLTRSSDAALLLHRLSTMTTLAPAPSSDSTVCVPM